MTTVHFESPPQGAGRTALHWESVGFAMKALPYLPLRRPEAGVALLISIFVLMLISVMALSLILASGTETSLADNYRSSASAYYAALAGLEEGRGRLLAKNPNYLGANNLPQPFPLNQVLYILNPGP